ncbi:MAG TPA: hypothetical protein VHC98_01900 [Candidatus Saccharimonadales bacterium]|nr:hypothetical protein [Candidatus Saccharimonadales bacterium]
MAWDMRAMSEYVCAAYWSTYEGLDASNLIKLQALQPLYDSPFANHAVQLRHYFGDTWLGLNTLEVVLCINKARIAVGFAQDTRYVSAVCSPPLHNRHSTVLATAQMRQPDMVRDAVDVSIDCWLVIQFPLILDKRGRRGDCIVRRHSRLVLVGHWREVCSLNTVKVTELL